MVIVDLLVSAGVRQRRVGLADLEINEAELTQEPYRGADWGRAYWQEIRRYTRAWEPYFVYRIAEMHGQYINVTSGVRTTYQPRISGRRRLVFLFGGSAAWGHGARDLGTLPSWLARVAEEHGDSWDVRNYAESGWVNWQGIVYLLEKLADGERPEAVVFYSGVNETLTRRQWPDTPRPIWNADTYPSAMSEWMMQRDRPLARAWAYYRNTSLVLHELFPQPSYYRPGPAPSAHRLTDLVSAEYLAEKALVDALGRQYGFASLFVWQPTVAAKPILSPQERRYAGWLPSSADTKPPIDWWSMGGDLRDTYQAIGRDVSRAGVIDLSSAFDGMSATAFIDWMHPAESGNERLARVLYGKMASQLR